MKKQFKQNLLINLLIVIMLIPMCIIINALISVFDNIPFWIIIGIISFVIINYLLYKVQTNDN